MNPDIDELADPAYDDDVVRVLDDAAEAQDHATQLHHQQEEEQAS